MKKLIFVLLASVSLCFSINAQTDSAAVKPTKTSAQTDAAKPKRQIFRARKKQLISTYKQTDIKPY